MMCDTCCKFQFTVGDVSSGVVKGDRPALDVSRKGASPPERLDIAIQHWDEVDPTHTHGCGIMGTHSFGLLLWGDVRRAYWPLSQVRSEPSEVSQDLMYCAIQPYMFPTIAPRAQHFLGHTKQPIPAWNG
jgi:hypothetical protein